MRIALALIPLTTGCLFDDTDFEEVPSRGDVSVTATGGTTVQASVCLGDKFLDCEGETAQVELRHDGVVTPMPFGGFLFPRHEVTAAMGDPTTMYEITDGAATAQMFLPPAFDLTGLPTADVRLGDTIEVRWVAGTSPMAYDITYDCGDAGSGGVGSRAVDDRRGVLNLDVAEVVAAIEETGSFTPATCPIEVRIHRISDGTLHPHFRANHATGVQERTFTFSVAP